MRNCVGKTDFLRINENGFFSESKFDVILMDVRMPVMDGLEALPTIRRTVPGAKIIVLSGFGATQMSERALANGADGYVQKGASLDSILDYVRDMTAGTKPRPSRSLSVVPPLDASESMAPLPPTFGEADPQARAGTSPQPLASGAATGHVPAPAEALRAFLTATPKTR